MQAQCMCARACVRWGRDGRGFRTPVALRDAKRVNVNQTSREVLHRYGWLRRRTCGRHKPRYPRPSHAPDTIHLLAWVMYTIALAWSMSGPLDAPHPPTGRWDLLFAVTEAE